MFKNKTVSKSKTPQKKAVKHTKKHVRKITKKNFATSARPRRSLLYIPGSSLKMLTKSLTCGADTVCMDLEDGVAISSKPDARKNIQQFLIDNFPKNFASNTEVCIRINPQSAPNGLYKEDVEWLLQLPVKPHAVALPKIETAQELEDIINVIKKMEAQQDGKAIELIGMTETPLGVVNLPQILEHGAKMDNNNQHLTALIFGGDDYANAIGAIRTDSNHEIDFARQMTLLHASVHGIGVIDIVCKEFKDLTKFREESKISTERGFVGRQNIHPTQIAESNAIYSPTPQLTRWAAVVVRDAVEYEKQGVGAWTFEGMMIDMPTVKRAQRILDRAAACGIDVNQLAVDNEQKQ